MLMADIQQLDNGVWRMLAEEAMEAVFVFDKEGNVLFANATALQETRYQSGCDNLKISIVYPDVVDDSGESFVWKKDKDNAFSTMAYRKNKTCYPVDIRCFEWNDGKAFYGIIVATDRTKQKDFESKWKLEKDERTETAKAKDEFVANITHELRTPLNGMKGLASNLLETELTNAQMQNLKIILSCCDNMIAIVNDILDFTKMQNPEFSLEKRGFNLINAINETIELHKPAILAKGLKYMFSMAEDVPEYVRGDEIRLKQILNNLLSNAVKFTSEGHIAFDVSVTKITEKTTELFFAVMDTGIGIDKKDRNKLFKKFSQVDSSISRKYGGTGLGLSITRQLVEMMGGRIDVESEKGKGSLFSFSVIFENADSEDADEDMIKTANMKIKREKSEEIKKKNHGREADAGINKPNKEYIMEMLEKIILCIELDIFDKAEAFSKTLKDKLADGLQRQRAFQLLLAVRRGDSAEALTYAEAFVQELGGED